MGPRDDTVLPGQLRAWRRRKPWAFPYTVLAVNGDEVTTWDWYGDKVEVWHVATVIDCTRVVEVRR